MSEILLNQVCYRTLGVSEPWTLERYCNLGGYSTWKAILAGQWTPEKVVAEVQASGLRGRGGAGFPSGLKWSFLPQHDTGPKYLVCNADESEPGAFKDRDILRFNPHQIIEGIAIGAFAMHAQTAYIYLRGEFAEEEYVRIELALEEAYSNGWLGQKCGDIGLDLEIHAVLGAGAYICGEETALMESLEGKRGLPRFKPPFPANYGVFGRPTNINNVETYASVPVILEKGAKWFSELGTPKNGGTKIFSISGHVNRPGNYEVPLGTPFKTLLDLAGGVWKNRSLKAVIPGGSSTPVLPAQVALDLVMDYDHLSAVGSFLGSGSIIVLDETVDMPALLERISVFYMRESCGQCSPCREGTGWLWRLIRRVNAGQADLSDLKTIDRVAAQMMGKTICALADAAAMPVLAFLKHFRAEFEQKILKGGV
ncbi:MAG: NADH-quinone oxidoreductase subunit NuoF [Gammaproteobacteria bacterium]|nr:NADH-quinone oxidoreductase subunit NuoF [Gammaproteobacteria bacterium]